ncbi:MAG: type 4a pilus biogenesis protein PilO [Thermodesulfobacteriota bacterium]
MNLKINTDVILKRSPLQRVLILVVINIIIGALGFFLLISPKIDEVTALTVELDELNQKIEESRTIASDIERYKREKKALQAKLKLALGKLPNEKEIPDLLESISDAVKEVGLDVFLFKPGKIRKKGFYAEVPVNMTVKGGYESLYEFSDRMAKLPRIVNIEGIKIKSKSRGLAPELETNLVVMTFMFVPPAPPKKKRRR